jgi:F-type H+-transporting ATPase subunit epsilon
VAGDDLATLDAEVLTRFQTDDDEERVEHVATMRLHMNAIRQMISGLRRRADTGKFR